MRPIGNQHLTIKSVPIFKKILTVNCKSINY